ncbi:hypothetical protein ACFQ1S_08120, partial [Kibdelosporangium lantanae]
AALCWGVDAALVLGGPLLTGRSERDGLVLLLIDLTACGFASMLRAGRAHHEARLACIPAQRRDERVTSRTT